MFKIKNIEINSSNQMVAVLNFEEAKELGLNPMDKIKIFSNKNSKFILCELEILDKKKSKLKLKKGELGLFENAFNKLNLSENTKVKIVPAKKALSIKYIKKKIEGNKLCEKEFLEIMIDIVENRYSKIETTYFVIACAIQKLSINEIISLTKSMINVGKQLEFKTEKNSIIVDKHCIGGIPGNRTTLLVVPIIAAAGLKIPKTSSRAITSPAGTADTMEIFADVYIGIDKMYNIVEEENGCIIWGGGIDLSPADDIIIQVEHPLDLDSEGQMIASILSKKKSAGSKFVLIDIPIGKTAKVTSMSHAKHLEKLFEKVGKSIGLKIKTIITDGSQPIGRGVGALYEAEDILKILKNKKDLPFDLKEKSLMMSGIILENAKICKIGEGYFLAKNILETGIAYTKFNKIIKIQGEVKQKFKAKFKYEIKSSSSGKIKEINNKLISKLAFVLGAPKDKAAGIYLNKKVNETIKKNETIITIYSNSKLRLKYSENFFNDNLIYNIKN